jgi:phage recombination protein Bet
MNQTDSKSPHGERESFAATSKELIEQTKGVTEEKIAEYLQAFGFAKTLLPNEIRQFTRIACEFQLNPFKREIYCVAYGEGQYRTCSIIVGYEVYIKRAERTGKLDGWKAWVEGEGETLKAKLEIYRKDWQHPFTHEVYWREAVQKKKDGAITSFWQKMPRFQLKKVAISQGFRICFPDELGGLPYDGAELGIEPPSFNKDDGVSYEIIESAEDGQPRNRHSESIRETPDETGESRPPASATGETQTQSSPGSLYDEIRNLTISSQDRLKPSHVEWIINQLQEEKTEGQLRGLLKHVKGKIAESDTAAVARPKTAEPGKPSGTGAAREAVIREIREILNAAGPDGKAYFSDDEKEETMQIIATIKENEAGLKELRDSRTFFAGELEKRRPPKTARKAA